ncbi:hypothetical protein OCU04_002303 [Sclerotinia nivalis]|uniref:Uncharacterized protein n=1 Tax=Sclerotinia nivalis TaxID=352851 RepID=A0A9X0DNF4_9HELO|nr:hypothetical protein OCU04_002303 [Sclerotinia nivalis]
MDNPTSTKNTKARRPKAPRTPKSVVPKFPEEVFYPENLPAPGGVTPQFLTTRNPYKQWAEIYGEDVPLPTDERNYSSYPPDKLRLGDGRYAPIHRYCSRERMWKPRSEFPQQPGPNPYGLLISNEKTGQETNSCLKCSLHGQRAKAVRSARIREATRIERGNAEQESNEEETSCTDEEENFPIFPSNKNPEFEKLEKEAARLKLKISIHGELKKECKTKLKQIREAMTRIKAADGEDDRNGYNDQEYGDHQERDFGNDQNEFEQALRAAAAQNQHVLPTIENDENAPPYTYAEFYDDINRASNQMVNARASFYDMYDASPPPPGRPMLDADGDVASMNDQFMENHNADGMNDHSMGDHNVDGNGSSTLNHAFEVDNDNSPFNIENNNRTAPPATLANIRAAVPRVNTFPKKARAARGRNVRSQRYHPDVIHPSLRAKSPPKPTEPPKIYQFSALASQATKQFDPNHPYHPPQNDQSIASTEPLQPSQDNRAMEIALRSSIENYPSISEDSTTSTQFVQSPIRSLDEGAGRIENGVFSTLESSQALTQAARLLTNTITEDLEDARRMSKY